MCGIPSISETDKQLIPQNKSGNIYTSEFIGLNEGIENSHMGSGMVNRETLNKLCIDDNLKELS